MFINKITSITSLTPPVANQSALVQVVYDNDQATFEEIVKLFPNGEVVPEISFTTTYKNVSLSSASYSEASLAIESVCYSNFTAGEVSEDDVADEEEKTKHSDEVARLNDDVVRSNENFERVAADVKLKEEELTFANETIAVLGADIESLKKSLDEANAERQAQATELAEIKASLAEAAKSATTEVTNTDTVASTPDVPPTGEAVNFDAPPTTPTKTTRSK